MYYFGNKLITPITPLGYNADLKWETTTTYNIGLDYGFLGDRIFGSVDLYKRDTKDLPEPHSAEARRRRNLSNHLNANIGDLTNKGFEFEFNAIPVHTRDWSLALGFNATSPMRPRSPGLPPTTSAPPTTSESLPAASPAVQATWSRSIRPATPLTRSSSTSRSMTRTASRSKRLGADLNEGLALIDDNDKYCFHNAAPDWTFGFNTQVAYKQ